MAGRPLKFKSLDEVQRIIDAYFESKYEMQWIDEPQRGENGEQLIDNNGRIITKPIRKKVKIEPFTVTGLANALGTSREIIIDYEDRAPFSHAIKAAKRRIYEQAEQNLLNRGNSGDIFVAKNFGWKDKTESDVNITGNLDLGAAFTTKK